MGMMPPTLSLADREAMARAEVHEAFETIDSLDRHGELIRLMLVEVAMLTARYRCVRRHDVPHISEMSGLLDLFWQEVSMADACTSTLD